MREPSQVLVLGDSFLRVYEQDDPGRPGSSRSVGAGTWATSDLDRQRRRRLHAGPPGAGTSPERFSSNKKLVIWEFAERDIRFGSEGWQIVPLPGTAGRPRLAGRRPRAASRAQRRALRSLAAVAGIVALPPWRGRRNMTGGNQRSSRIHLNLQPECCVPGGLASFNHLCSDYCP